MRFRLIALLAVLAALSLAACASGPSPTVAPSATPAPAHAPAQSLTPHSPAVPPSKAPAPPAPSASRPATSAPSASGPASSAPAGEGVGDTQTVNGLSDGETLAVTLTKVADPATPADEFSTPQAGDRLVGTQFRIANAGSVPYHDAIDNDVQLIDEKGQAYQPELADSITAGRLFEEVRIDPGDSRLGFVVFSVPSGMRLATVQFVPDSGLADDTAQWTLPAGHASSSESAAPVDVVRAYFDAINAGDYRRAWDLGGKNLGGSYESFAAGFADTVSDTVTVTSTSGAEVSVTLDADQSDGSIRHYVGTYTVREGVITAAHVVPRCFGLAVYCSAAKSAKSSAMSRAALRTAAGLRVR